MANRPPAKLELVATGEGKKEKKKFGVVWASKFPGSYAVALSLPHPTETSNGYPVEDDVIAIKCRSGAKYIIDKKEGFFINLNVYEALEARPPYDGPRNDSPRGKSEDFEDDDNF